MKLTAGAVLALAAVAGGVFIAWRVTRVASSVGDAIGAGATSVANAVGTAANAVSPLNHDNVFATGVNAVGGAIVTDPDGPGKNADGSWTLGGALYDVFSDADDRIRDMLAGKPEPARNTGGATGGWTYETADPYAGTALYFAP